jgi:hypothetical protein
MDEAGFVIGATSLFLQVFKGAVDAFSFWSKGDAITKEASVFQVRLEGQAAKFKAWGVQWGVDLGMDSPSMTDEKFKKNASLATKYVVMIHHFLDTLQDLGSEFPIIRSAENLPPSTTVLLRRAKALVDVEGKPHNPFLDNLEALKAETSVKEKVRWAVQDGGPLKTLELLRDLIQDLYDIFPPPTKDSVAEHVLNALLASLDRSKLQSLTEESSGNPTLRGLAFLKSMILQMEARNIVLKDGRVWERRTLLTDVGENDERKRRSVGKFRGEPVLIEWKYVNNSAELTYKDMVRERIENLARLLKAKHKPEELQTLECLGVVKQLGTGNNEIYYGIIFATPLEIQCSLHDILSNKPEELALGDWFTIAKQFVKTVLFLHLAGWVHKAIRSDNLLFFDKSDYSNLRLVGFEYSRQATSAQQTEGVADDLEFNLYRHPEVQGGSVPTTAKISYSPKHDIYSVGVVLLELGLKESMLNLLKTANSQPSYDHSGTAFMGFLIEQQVPKLGTVMGKTYMNVTMQCLDGSLLNEQERSLQESVYLKVFRPLEQYQVL